MSKRIKLAIAWIITIALALLLSSFITTSMYPAQSCDIPPNIQVGASDPCAVYLKFAEAFNDAKARRWWERTSTGNDYHDLGLAAVGPLLILEYASLPYRGSFQPGIGGTAAIIEIRANAWTEGAGIHEAYHLIWWKQGDRLFTIVGHGTQNDPLLPLLIRERGWLYPYVPGHPYTPVIVTADGVQIAAAARCTF